MEAQASMSSVTALSQIVSSSSQMWRKPSDVEAATLAAKHTLPHV